MARYIDADKMIEHINEERTNGFPYNENLSLYALSVLAHQPAADVVEVVHGEWIPTGGETLFLREFSCSRCKSIQLGSTNYCPNCGAKMEERRWSRNDY